MTSPALLSFRADARVLALAADRATETGQSVTEAVRAAALSVIADPRAVRSAHHYAETERSSAGPRPALVSVTVRLRPQVRTSLDAVLMQSGLTISQVARYGLARWLVGDEPAAWTRLLTEADRSADR